MLAKSMYHHCLRFDCLENCCPNYSVFPNTLCGISLWIVPCFFRFDISPTTPSPSRMLCHQIRLSWLWSFGHFIARANLRRKRSWVAMVHMLESFRDPFEDCLFEVFLFKFKNGGKMLTFLQRFFKFWIQKLQKTAYDFTPSQSSSLFCFIQWNPRTKNHRGWHCFHQSTTRSGLSPLWRCCLCRRADAVQGTRMASQML